MPLDRRWDGFSVPTYTQIPDEFFDDLMVDLSEAELRVLLYLMRRTFGFKKNADAISLKQIINGIQTKDGRVLDRGAGLSHTSVKRALKGLLDEGVISVAKVLSESGDYETNIYAIIFRGVGTQVAPGRHEEFPPVGNYVAYGVGTRSASQETVEQETVEQEIVRSNHSKETNGFLSKEDAEQIAWVVRDIAQEFSDQAPLKSTTTRAQRLYLQSGKSLHEFLDAIQAARLRTKQHTGSIKTERSANGAKPKVAYWFGVVEDLIGVKIDETDH